MFADGYFPRGESVLRQVQEERLVGLFYGQRALCIGALAPLNYVGTSEHTRAKLTPFKRLVHTGNAFGGGVSEYVALERHDPVQVDHGDLPAFRAHPGTGGRRFQLGGMIGKLSRQRRNQAGLIDPGRTLRHSVPGFPRPGALHLGRRGSGLPCQEKLAALGR